MGVKFICRRYACAMCLYTPDGMDGKALIYDWLHSAAVPMAENSRAMYNAHP